MKKVIFSFLFLMAVVTVKAQQHYCIIDSKYMLDKMSDYKDAQNKLDGISKTWQEEIDKMMAEVDNLYKSYQAEKPMLSDEMRRRREDEIVAKEKAAKDLQKQRFGYEGDLFKKRQEFIKPVQDRLYNAVQKMAQGKGYDLVLDKAGGITLFYADPKLDKSDDVLKILGINK
ncbi:MAG: OmpH family outer membrane protein [Flavipsychrobacter sp.]|jgi:outer membrane protein|nr:OmpH family outer membrane protein [Flavipsychrobacter sp.]